MAACSARAVRNFLFRDDGTMPDEVEIRLDLPAELGDPDQLLLELRRQIAEVEAACARDRQVTGRQVVGRRAIRRQSWRHSPTSREPRRNLLHRVSPDAASGHGSRRSSATATSSRSTAPRARDGSLASPPSFRPVPTGSHVSRTCRWRSPIPALSPLRQLNRTHTAACLESRVPIDERAVAGRGVVDAPGRPSPLTTMPASRST